MYQDLFPRFGFSADCPWPTNSKFYDFCKLYTTGSMLGAELLSLNEVRLTRLILLSTGVEDYIMLNVRKLPDFATSMIVF
jgi:hypothetical protein